MEDNFGEAFYEVDKILNLMPKELVEKIPHSFQKIINDNKSTTYNKEIKGLENLNILKKETIVILSLIYRDFLCDKTEKEKILEKEQKIIEERYSYDKLFKKNMITYCTNNECTDLVTINKDKWYKRIISFFKNKRN
ncbi:MAG: hypothetical protein IJN50_02885 [Clostridia bacterium]|nr:hypothetical protein [Clostridia bacterium]